MTRRSHNSQLAWLYALARHKVPIVALAGDSHRHWYAGFGAPLEIKANLRWHSTHQPYASRQFHRAVPHREGAFAWHGRGHIENHLRVKARLTGPAQLARRPAQLEQHGSE